MARGTVCHLRPANAIVLHVVQGELQVSPSLSGSGSWCLCSARPVAEWVPICRAEKRLHGQIDPLPFRLRCTAWYRPPGAPIQEGVSVREGAEEGAEAGEAAEAPALSTKKPLGCWCRSHRRHDLDPARLVRLVPSVLPRLLQSQSNSFPSGPFGLHVNLKKRSKTSDQRLYLCMPSDVSLHTF